MLRVELAPSTCSVVAKVGETVDVTSLVMWRVSVESSVTTLVLSAAELDGVTVVMTAVVLIWV